MKKIIFFLFLTAAFFSSCVSMKKDIFLNSQISQSDKNIEAIEEAVVPLEAAGGAQARSRQSEITAARQLITNKEKEASADAEYGFTSSLFLFLPGQSPLLFYPSVLKAIPQKNWK